MNQTIPSQLSGIRLISMRIVYLFSGIFVGMGSWPEVVHPAKPWDLMHSVAFSLYAAWSLLMLLGARFPVTMLPLLLLQLLYKLLWLIAFGYPMWSSGQGELVSGVNTLFGMMVIVDLAVIPWPYVFHNYLRAIFQRRSRAIGDSVRHAA